MFGLAVIAAVLNLMVLKFMTMNTEDEKRDEIEAIQVSKPATIGQHVKHPLVVGEVLGSNLGTTPHHN